MNIYEKLTELQNELIAPKSLRNTFANFNYRSAEGILEAVKPLLKKYKLTQTILDEMVLVGDRYYIQALIVVTNIEEPTETIRVTALAREPENKKGMDASQITGTSSSYARKYALNGLYAIDDTKDSDFTNTDNGASEKPIPKPSRKEYNDLFELSGKNEDIMNKAMAKIGLKDSSQITKDNLFKVEVLVREIVENNEIGEVVEKKEHPADKKKREAQNESTK